MKIIIINPPPYTPTTFPYSLAALKSEITNQLANNIEVLDLNASYHFQKFKQHYQKLTNNEQDYFSLLEGFNTASKKEQADISKSAMNNQNSEASSYCVEQIKKNQPDILAISLTYNSQVFVSKQIINKIKLENPNIKIVLGGPADYSKIIEDCKYFPNAKEFINYLISIGANKNNKIKEKVIPDFSDFKKEHYFTPEIIYPIRTSVSCPYKQCTFCTHHGNNNFDQYDLSTLKETILKNKMNKICFIDDDLTPIRLKQISDILKEMNVNWWCQLRPIKQIQRVLPEANEAGLRSVAWGLESGNQRVLDLIKKGTNLQDIKETLETSSKLGIKNMTYVLFGFPTETESEFIDTINFLEQNKEFIDILSPSVFGLQYGSKVMKNPELFNVQNIEFEERRFLSNKISYKTTTGLSKEQIKKLMKKYKHQMQQINKVPRIISVYKEQILNLKE